MALAKQIAIRRLGTDHLVEGSEHQQPVGVGEITIARRRLVETQFAITVVLEQPHLALGQPAADLLFVLGRHQATLRRIGG
ncbi:hypothetical protein D3C80_1049910 [compost metagenome]